MGWRIKGSIPIEKKYILIAAPHSSNWDFVFFLFVVFKFRLSIHWMGKHTMFKWPFKWVLKRLGGIPIDRRENNNLVDAMTAIFNESKELIVTIAPSGTRRKVSKWKTGFYRIANQAKIPIACGFIDYKNKIIGIDQVISPTGNMEEDISTIRSFYTNYSGKV